MKTRFFSCLVAVGFLNSGGAFALPHPLYDVKVEGNQLVATAKAEDLAAEALRIVDSSECKHQVVGKNRIQLEGACGYISALYHYVPASAQNDPRTQVTGGFAFSRKSASSYVLEVAQGMQISTSPALRTSPVPEELKK